MIVPPNIYWAQTYSVSGSREGPLRRRESVSECAWKTKRSSSCSYTCERSYSVAKIFIAGKYHTLKRWVSSSEVRDCSRCRTGNR